MTDSKSPPNTTRPETARLLVWCHARPEGGQALPQTPPKSASRRSKFNRRVAYSVASIPQSAILRERNL